MSISRRNWQLLRLGDVQKLRFHKGRGGQLGAIFCKLLQLVADPRNLVLKKCACPSFYVVNYADLLSKAQNMHTLHFFKMHTSFLLSIENNLRLIVFVLIARKKCCRAVEETS